MHSATDRTVEQSAASDINDRKHDIIASALAFATGLSAFLPIGIVYLSWFIFIIYLLARWRTTSYFAIRTTWIIALLGVILAPPVIATISVAFHGLHEQTATRLFHAYRTAILIGIGLMVNQNHRLWIFRGIVVGALGSVMVIGIHRFITPLPLQHPFHDLLQVTGNAGSQKMIMLACVAGMLFWMFLGAKTLRQRWLFLIGWLIFGTTVALHSISRNAYLLLLALPAAGLIYRYRSPKSWFLAAAISVCIGAAIWMASDAVRIRTLFGIEELQSYFAKGNYSGSANARARMTMEAAHQMMANPIFGTGTGTWLEHWRNVAQDTPDVNGINNPHNDYLLAGMENGIPGLLAMVILIGTFLYVNWKANNEWGGMGFVGTLAVAITAAVNAPFRDAVLGMALIWVMACFTRLPSRRSHHDTM